MTIELKTNAKTQIIMISFLFIATLSLILMTGCANSNTQSESNLQKTTQDSERDSFNNLTSNDTYPNMRNNTQKSDIPRAPNDGPQGNLSAKERDAQFEEIQKISIEACENKNEGDACTISDFHQNSTNILPGICTNDRDRLRCIPEMQKRP